MYNVYVVMEQESIRIFIFNALFINNRFINNRFINKPDFNRPMRIEP